MTTERTTSLRLQVLPALRKRALLAVLVLALLSSVAASIAEASITAPKPRVTSSNGVNCNNDPVNRTDPTGMFANWVLGGLIGGVGGGFYGAYNEGLSGLVRGGLTGAASGAVAGGTFGLALIPGSGAAGAAIASGYAGLTGGFVAGASHAALSGAGLEQTALAAARGASISALSGIAGGPFGPVLGGAVSGASQACLSGGDALLGAGTGLIGGLVGGRLSPSARAGVGDLNRGELATLRGIASQIEHPVAVVGSAARSGRRMGSDLDVFISSETSIVGRGRFEDLIRNSLPQTDKVAVGQLYPDHPAIVIYPNGQVELRGR